ncbi:5-methylcytosine-specific restriction endonuclease system specificity protein McrC [Candidatus Haliotispira prima]|uniref:5-methylcytosine-specific restriction endonuclease system specificity protein McrC n=1 Tax=Candidatus Haliotispira prima TaxID=3034016 RepID=A0ABY8MMF8_9SPIO|nr:5-methylcytosine-specific restriction endonuclease system specificity protein McrC [Candidatus Haliotispira prima]
MSDVAAILPEAEADPAQAGYVGKIPVRNLWLLMLYASDLFRQLAQGAPVSVEDNPDDIPDLVAEILSKEVEQRIKRNLSFGYRTREASLNRVRGRINVLKTERHRLLEKGKVFCRFDELTVDTPRNRFARAALEKISNLVKRRELAHKCRSMANSLRCMGVVGEKPGHAEVSTDRFGRHDAIDRKMLAAAHLAFNLALPTESAGTKYLSLPDREITWIRRLYEKGVAGFYNCTLSDQGWRIEAGKYMYWPMEADRKSPGMDKIFPSMCTDITLSHKDKGRRLIIDTKFNAIVTKGWYREQTIRSGYIYQIYAYLRSQEGRGDPLADRATGILLHPSIGSMLNESVTIQGHEIRFVTVDLSAETKRIREQLLQIVEANPEFC